MLDLPIQKPIIPPKLTKVVTKKRDPKLLMIFLTGLIFLLTGVVVNNMAVRNYQKLIISRFLVVEIRTAQAATTFTVNDTGDGVDATPGDGICATAGAVCTLRAAIAESNSLAGTDTIGFNIGGGGLQTIAPASALPQITTTMTLDASTQPGFASAPLIELNGTSAGIAHGFDLSSPTGVIIRGFIINRFLGAGINGSPSNSTFDTNYIGVNAAGSTASGNAAANPSASAQGINLTGGTGNIIGTPTGRNIFGGSSTKFAILISDGSNTIQNNYIGVNAAGTAASGIIGTGIQVTGGSGNLIGGDGSQYRNVIATGSASFGGISLSGATVSGTIIQGNFFGTNATGNATIPCAGILLINAANTTIGGNSSSKRNVISNPNGPRINITGATNSIIQGNYIGLKATGDAGLVGSSNNILIAATTVTQTIIGGTGPGEGNVISSPGGNGIAMTGTNAGTVTIQGNIIGLNAAGTAAISSPGNAINIAGATNTQIGESSVGARNVISGNGSTAITLQNLSTGTHTIQGNYIGLNATGDAKIANAGSGISMFSPKTVVIGGSNAGEGNIISGNTANGISMTGVAGSGPVSIKGNYIGLDATGTNALGNTGIGISNTSLPNVTVGGTTVAERNVISGNGLTGISIISTATSTGMIIKGNYIGTDVSGTLAKGNTGYGIDVAQSATIGGSVADEGNLISGNYGGGINLSNTLSSNSTIQGNNIGTGIAGTEQIGNSGNGINFLAAGVTGVSIGGTTTEAKNIIANNSGYGIIITTATSNNNKISGNKIFSNGSMGIDLTVGPVNYTASGPWNMVAGDFNGDTKQDLATTFLSSNTIAVLIGNGDGTFATAVNYAVGTAPAGIAVGDFNGDTKQDLAVGNTTTNNVSILIGNGDGTFATAVNYAVVSGAYSIAVADYNGDTKQDLAVVNLSTANISILIGNGDGTFATAVNYAVGTNPIWIATGDFNGDTKQDLAIANSLSNNISILIGNGDGTFASAVNYAVAATPQVLRIGDVNADGKQDIVAEAGTILVLAGNGDGTFTSAFNYGAGAATLGMTLGDINGDGTFDVILPSSDKAGVYIGNGDGTFKKPINYPLPQSGASRSAVIGDFNGDGKQDLAAANRNINNVSILLELAEVTANDTLDSDTAAPNNLQNFPIINSAVNIPSNTRIAGTLNSTANSTFSAEFFGNTTCDASENGEGETYLGNTSVTTDGSGNATFSTDISPQVANGKFITATATDSTNNTSEFSACSTQSQVATLTDMQVTSKAVDDATPATGETIIFSIAVENAGPNAVTTASVADAIPAGLTYVSSTPSVGSYNSGTGTWTIGSMAVNDTATISIRMTVNSDAYGQNITNTATISSELGDSDASNNAASVSVQVQAVPPPAPAPQPPQATPPPAAPEIGPKPFIVTIPGASTNGVHVDPLIRVLSPFGRPVAGMGNFYPYNRKYDGGGYIAVGDVTGDGNSDIIVGEGTGKVPGQGGAQRIRVFRPNGILAPLQFQPFDKNFDGGISVATGDVDGDGKHEIGACQATKGQAWCKVMRYNGKKEVLAFWNAFGNFNNGATIAFGDITGDGKDEVIVGPGPTGSTQIRVYSIGTKAVSGINKGARLKPITFFAFSPKSKSGISVSSADFDQDGKDEIVGAQLDSKEEGWIKVYRYNRQKTVLSTFRAYAANSNTGAWVNASDIDGDNIPELITGGGDNGGAHMRGFTLKGALKSINFFPYSAKFRGGVRFGVGVLR